MERSRYLLLSVGAVLILNVALVLGQSDFKSIFISRCENLKEYDCQVLWTSFEQAYVGRDPCNVPMEAYNDFIAAVDLKTARNSAMLWSKTKDLVHKFTKKKGCFITLEDTLLGRVADNLTWCGKVNSTETFTTNCPGWTDCENNTVRSYWRRASKAFAQHAEGNVTAMLNGSNPYDPNSIFRTIEIPNLTSPRVTYLNVILVTTKGTCDSESLKELQSNLQDKSIKYSCNPMTQARVESCAEDSNCFPCPSGSGTSEFILRTPYVTTVFYVLFSLFFLHSSI